MALKYNFFIDDNIFCFAEIYENNYNSIFECDYLANLRRLHEKYNLKVTLNTFLDNFHKEFHLSQFSEKYKEEFVENSSWLKFAFHARCEVPEYPYQNSPNSFVDDYNEWENEMKRIVSSDCIIAPVIVHYYSCPKENVIFLREKGTRFLAKVDCPQSRIFNSELDIFDIRVETFLNFHKATEIEAVLNKIIANNPNDICIGSHEQFAFKFYANYMDDYFVTMEKMCQILKANNFESIFFNLNDSSLKTLD